METIGIIAGGGQFPLVVAAGARKSGLRVAAAAHLGETDESLTGQVDRIAWVKLGEIQKILDTFREEGVRRAVMAGGITKKELFANMAPDARALALLGRLTEWSDDVFLRALADEFASQGLEILPSTEFCPEIVLKAGNLSRRVPDDVEAADVAYGWRIAKALGELDVGQCVVVKNKTVMALEAIDGTDATIRRGGRLGREKSVVVKVVKPQQDLRFDLPAVGLHTIDSMEASGATVLAVEADRTVAFDRDAMIAAADRAGIAIVALGED